MVAKKGAFSCHVCGGTPNSSVKGKSVARLVRCESCGTVTCNNHLKIGFMQMVCPKCKGVKLRTIAESKGGGSLGWGNKKSEPKKAPEAKTNQQSSGGGMQSSDGSRLGSIGRSGGDQQQTTHFVADSSSDAPVNIQVQNLTMQITNSVLNSSNSAEVSQSDLSQTLANTSQNLLVNLTVDTAPVAKQLAAQGANINIEASEVNVTASEKGAKTASDNVDAVDEAISDETAAASAAEDNDLEETPNPKAQLPILFDALFHIRSIADWEDVLNSVNFAEDEEAWTHKITLSLNVADEALMARYIEQASALPENCEVALGLPPQKYAELEAFNQAKKQVVEGQYPLSCVGLAGLDQHFAGYAMAQQLEALQAHIQLSEDLGGKPILLSLKGDAQILQQNLEKVTFNTSVALFAENLSIEGYAYAKEKGWFLAVLPAATYETAETYRQAIESWPLDKLLIASGSRLVLPATQTSGLNKPEYILDILSWLATARTMREDKLLEQLSLNAKQFLR